MAGAVVEGGRRPAAAEPAEPPITDWVLRPFAATHASPLWAGLGLAAVFLGACVVARVAAGELGAAFWRYPFFWSDVLNAVLFAYIPTASWMVRRGRLRDLRELRPLLRADAASFERLERQAVCVPPRRLASSGLIGALLMAAMPIFDPAFWEEPRPPLQSPWMLFMIARHVAVGWVGGHAIASELTGTRAFYEIGGTELEVDLHDLRPLAPFARAGQRSAFAWVLAASLVSLFWLGPAPGSSNGPILVATLAAVSAFYFFSIYGAHQNIRDAKQQVLDRLSAQIRTRSEGLLAGSHEAPPVAELVAFHGFIAQLREWPIGAPALLRGGLIAALAVGSWLGGALVERLTELALG